MLPKDMSYAGMLLKSHVLFPSLSPMMLMEVQSHDLTFVSRQHNLLLSRHDHIHFFSRSYLTMPNLLLSSRKHWLQSSFIVEMCSFQATDCGWDDPAICGLAE